MKKRNFYFILTLLLAVLGTVVSCKKDKEPIVPAPVINLEEVGSGNNKKATAGSDLHLEGTIKAEGLIQRIDIEIHQEGGSFEIEKSYTEGKYIGVKEAVFHEHLDIPANAPAGDYHLHLTVTDKNGQKTEVESELELEAKFDITEHFVALTILPKTGSSKYTSVAFIQFIEDNKALYIGSSATNIVGTYMLTDTELTFEVTGGNARTAKFTLDKDKKITSAFYQGSGPLEYETTGDLFSLKANNELAGKTFKGDEYGMSGTLNRAGVYFSFNKEGINTYGSGTDEATIDKSANNYALFGGNGFKHINGSTTELGFVSNKKLTVFKVSGLYFSGKYDQQ